MEAPASSGGEQIDDFLDCCIGTMIGRLEPAIGSALRVGPVVEAAVGERTAQALMKEEEQQSNLDAFCREAVGIVSSVPLQQAVSLELAQIVAQLVQAIALLREPEGGEHGFMDLLSRPAADVRAAVQEDLHQPDDAGLVDLDAGIAHGPDGNRQGDALEQRKVDVDVEPLRLEAGEPVGDGLELLADRLKIIQALLESEVLEIIGAELVPQECVSAGAKIPHWKQPNGSVAPE